MTAFTADYQAGGSSLRSRRLLLGTAGGACGAGGGGAVPHPLAGAAAGPGPEGDGLPGRRPAGGARGRLAGAPRRPRGRRVHHRVARGHTGASGASTLLIRFGDDQGFEPRPGREDWTVDNLVAYSKLCTHVGCPVGLYQSESALLLCPCHQSTFDVARRQAGLRPAARSLPQLPLGLDDEGYVIATADFSGPVGPGFWDRGGEAPVTEDPTPSGCSPIASPGGSTPGWARPSWRACSSTRCSPTTGRS